MSESIHAPEHKEWRRAVMNIIRSKQAQFGDAWTWGEYYEDLSRACGVLVGKPDEGEKKDRRHPARIKFTRSMHEVIPESEYSVATAHERLDQLVDAIRRFEP